MTIGKKIKFIGIGAQKCGTTWIHRQLDKHPDINVASGKDKDTRFFTCFYDRGYEWYQSSFPEETQKTLTGEVSTSYFYDADAPSRIHLYNPNVKLFVCLRNPIERILSNHRHEIKSAHITGDNLTLKKALENNPAYLLQSRYAEHLKRWYETFPKNQLKVLFFDDIKSDPEKLIKELFDYLNVDSDIELGEIKQAENVSLIPENKNIDAGFKAVSKALRNVGLGNALKFSKKIGANDWLKQKNTTSKTNHQESFEISEDILNYLKDQLKEDVMELEHITDRKLDMWG